MTHEFARSQHPKSGFNILLTLCFFAFIFAYPAILHSRTANPPAPAIQYSYADIADLARLAPIVIDGTISKAQKLPPEQSAGVKSGRVRMLITLDLVSLIRGPQGSPARITYLADVPLTAKGKAPKLKKQRVIVFARAIPGKTDAVQLQTPNAQLTWSPDTDTQVRAILRELREFAPLPRPLPRPLPTGVRQ